MTYTDEITAQPGWREITRDEITEGTPVRTVVTYGDRITTYEGIADHQEGGDWWTSGGRYLNTEVSTVRIFTPCADSLPRELGAGEAGKLPAGARFQVITTYCMGDPWVPEGDPTYRLLHLPEVSPDPVLIDLIGEDAARKIAEAGLVCEPRARL